MDGRTVPPALGPAPPLTGKLELEVVALDGERKEVEAMVELAPRVPSD
jgi:hypothetical protein